MKRYIQGTETDAELFAAVGAFVVSKAVHDEQGNAITAESGDIWHVEGAGFAVTRISESKIAHVRFLHGPSKDRQAMLSEILKELAVYGVTAVYTFARAEGAAIWERARFKLAYQKKNSAFAKYEKDLAA